MHKRLLVGLCRSKVPFQKRLHDEDLKLLQQTLLGRLVIFGAIPTLIILTLQIFFPFAGRRLAKPCLSLALLAWILCLEMPV